MKSISRWTPRSSLKIKSRILSPEICSLSIHESDTVPQWNILLMMNILHQSVTGIIKLPLFWDQTMQMYLHKMLFGNSSQKSAFFGLVSCNDPCYNGINRTDSMDLWFENHLDFCFWGATGTSNKSTHLIDWKFASSNRKMVLQLCWLQGDGLECLFIRIFPDLTNGLPHQKLTCP